MLSLTAFLGGHSLTAALDGKRKDDAGDEVAACGHRYFHPQRPGVTGIPYPSLMNPGRCGLKCSSPKFKYQNQTQANQSTIRPVVATMAIRLRWCSVI